MLKNSREKANYGHLLSVAFKIIIHNLLDQSD
jgi:hypothetical protein